ncbi:membrane hypothetical protein [uncultured Paludibacter sp.]|nr:membrane hypothetical protein [uncultured Paludibacter sp.]
MHVRSVTLRFSFYPVHVGFVTLRFLIYPVHVGFGTLHFSFYLVHVGFVTLRFLFYPVHVRFGTLRFLHDLGFLKKVFFRLLACYKKLTAGMFTTTSIFDFAPLPYPFSRLGND